LPITKGIIEAHGGAIWVESDGYDESSCPGSTFHILLPVRKDSPDDNVNNIFEPMNSEQLVGSEHAYEEIKDTIAKESPWQKK